MESSERIGAEGERRAEPSSWRTELSSVGRSSYDWLARPRVRLTLTGVLLLLIGAVIISSSVWTLPLVIAGALMIVTAWIGHRLEGRFVVEWGEAGAELGFRATVKAAQPALQASSPADAGSQRPGVEQRLESEPGAMDVIEGEAHTVEIDVAELKALIAAAEAQDGPTTATHRAAHEVRIRRVSAGGRAASPSQQ